MANIEYDVQPNKLTVPTSYAPRVRTRGVITRAQFAQQIAQLGNVDVSLVYTIWNLQSRALVDDLVAGMSVEVDDLTSVSVSMSGKMDGPNDPLPADWELKVNLRPDSKLLEAVRTAATVTRVEPLSAAPMLTQVSAAVGDLQALVPGMVVQSEGYRQSFSLDRADEGAFLVPSDGAPAVRFTNYLASGDRKLLMAVPTGLSADTNWTLEVRARTRGALPTGPLYIGTWGTPLHSA